jgi:hypothetical protein
LAAGFQATKVTVLSLSGTRDQFPSMLIAPYARRGTNLVPFRSSDGEGATICLAGDDELCDRRNALDADLPSGIRDRYERGFRRYLPGIEALARPSIPGHIYVCQKLTPLEVDGVAHNPRGELVAEIIEDLEEADGQRALVAAYPGKFTAAPIVADGIVTNLRQRFDPQVRVLYSADAPTIAKQRYFDANDIQLTAHDGAVEFEDLFPDA